MEFIEGMIDAAMCASLSALELEKLEKIRAIKGTHPNNLAVKHFDEAYFNSLPMRGKIALLTICNSGIENVDSGMG